MAGPFYLKAKPEVNEEDLIWYDGFNLGPSEDPVESKVFMTIKRKEVGRV